MDVGAMLGKCPAPSDDEADPDLAAAKDLITAVKVGDAQGVLDACRALYGAMDEKE